MLAMNISYHSEKNDGKFTKIRPLGDYLYPIMVAQQNIIMMSSAYILSYGVTCAEHHQLIFSRTTLRETSF